MNQLIKTIGSLILFSLLAIFLFTTCTKGGGNIYFSGRVYNPISNEGVPNVRIKLIQKTLTGGDVITGSSKVRGEVITNSNGEFEMIETVTGSNLRYLIEYDESKYHLIGWDVAGNNGKPVLKGEDDYDNLKMVPFGNFRTHVKNVNCVDEFDSLQTSFTYLLDEKTVSNSYFTTGCYENMSNSTIMDNPIGDYRFDWYVIRSGVRTDSSKIFTVNEGQHTLVEVFY